ncbi:MAG: HAD family phosphatase [Phycisphaerales bacterium]|nr:HAD family phosphatase [Phycisphaerales bacterium]
MNQAIIFDFDGVIVESEPLHYEAFRSVLPEFGIQLTRESYYARYVGLADREIVRRLLADHDRRLTQDETEGLMRKKNTEYERQIMKGIDPLPGVAELIKRTSNQHPLAICSGSKRREISMILDQIGLSAFFSVIVASDDVLSSKPDPAGYLLALSQLRRAKPDLTAEKCLVFEDSEAGISAAKAAGMKVIAIRKDDLGTDTASADGTIASFLELENVDLASLVSESA